MSYGGKLNGKAKEKETLGAEKSTLDGYGSLHGICMYFFRSFFYMERYKKVFQRKGAESTGIRDNL